MNRVFNRHGIQLISAFTGEELLQFWDENPKNRPHFDLVIMDLTIPGGMGGKETITELRKREPSIRAIVSSGYSNDPVMANFESWGFCDVLPKPFTVRLITDLLSKYLII